MPALDKSIKKLRQLAPVLNKTTDDAARVVQEVENLLSKDLGLGIDESVVIHSYNVSKVKEQITSLAYRRVAGKFRIAVVVE